MSKKTNPALVGAFVLGAILLALGGIVLLGAKDLFHKSYPFVAYFPSSVNGLRQGAAVKFKGVEIGSVDRIHLPLTSQPQDPPVVVFFSLDADKLRASKGENIDADALQDTIGAGLRVRLEQESYVTGMLYLSMVFAPDSEVKLHDPIPGIPEIPTAPTEFEQLTAQIKSFIDTLEKVDFASVVDDLQVTVRSIGELFRSGQVQHALASFDEMSVSVGGTAATVKQEIGPLVESLRAAADRVGAAGVDVQGGVADARETLETIRKLADSLERSVQALAGSVESTLRSARAVIDPGSPPVTRLERALAELSATARAARAVLEVLERDPAALLRGKGAQEEKR